MQPDAVYYIGGSDVLPPPLTESECLKTALSGCKTVVLGITPCNEEMKISTPFQDEILSAERLILSLSPGSIIIGGKLSPASYPVTIGDRHSSNTELIAQGIGNMGSALMGGIPATGAIARTAASIMFTVAPTLTVSK